MRMDIIRKMQSTVKYWMEFSIERALLILILFGMVVFFRPYNMPSIECILEFYSIYELENDWIIIIIIIILFQYLGCSNQM